MTDKQYKSVADVFEETKKELANPVQKMDYDPEHDLNNIRELKNMKARIDQIVQEYGSNSQERDNLHAVSDLIDKATSKIRQKIRSNAYMPITSIHMESSQVEQLSPVITSANTVIDYLANGFEDIGRVVKKVVNARKAADRGDYTKALNELDAAEKELRNASNQLSRSVAQQFNETLTEIRRRVGTGSIVAYEEDLPSELIQHCVNLKDEAYTAMMGIEYFMRNYTKYFNERKLQNAADGMSDIINMTEDFIQEHG